MDVVAGLAVVVVVLVSVVTTVRAVRRARRVTAWAQQAASRERCLLAASRRLAATSRPGEVDELVAEVAHELLGQEGARSVVWEEQGEAWVAIASCGPARVEVAPSVNLPVSMLARMDVGEPWVLDTPQATTLQEAYGLAPRFRSFVYVPLPRREGPRAVLALSCLRAADPDLTEALRRFVQEVAVAEDRARLLAEVAEREARLASVLQGSSDIIGMLDSQGTITFLNRATQALHGYDPDQLVGTNVFDLFHPEDRGTVLRATLDGDLEAGVQVSHRMYDAAGLLRHVETMVSRPVGATQGYVLNVRDVTDRKALEDELVHHARHDALTGVANRRAFTERLAQALARFGRGGRPLGLIMIDLDDFKPVNDTHGHQAGDEVLVEVARRLAAGVRTTDLVARVGGDEFAVVVEEATTAGEVGALAARLAASVAAPISLPRGQRVQVTASLGIASAWPGCDGDELLREADQALYVNKRARQGDDLPTTRT